VIVTALRLAADQNFNHIPDNIVQEAIEVLK